MALQEIIDQLREDTAVFRTTLRTAADGFMITCESLGEGAASLKGPVPFDLSKTDTYRWLEDERKILVQNDVREGPAPPRQLSEVYGVGSQLLSGIFNGERMTGIISVHHAAETREWTGVEIAALERAAAAVTAELVGG
jgi:GAF domain-containing protein